MTDRLKQALQHAEEAGRLYGLNVVGNTLRIIEQAVEACGEFDGSDPSNEGSYENLCEMWEDIGSETVRHELLGCDGHMTHVQVEAMKTEVIALAKVVTEECDTLDEVREALKAKE